MEMRYKQDKRDHMSESLNRHESANKSPVTFVINSGRGHQMKPAGSQELQLAKAAIPGLQINPIFPSIFLSRFFKA